AFDLSAVQSAIRDAGFDGWLFYDFRGSDPIARSILRLDPSGHSTRRWYYWVPKSGEPKKLVHAIESAALDSLPGTKRVYLSWQSLEEGLADMLAGRPRVAMQYSPGNQVPYVSRVDAGTIEVVRKLGAEPLSSGDILQLFDAVLDEEGYASHERAARVLGETVREAFDHVGTTLRAGRTLDEAGLLAFVESRLREHGLVYDHPAIIGVNEHAADPHFEVPARGSAPIRKGDVLLLDVWAKEDRPGAIYADITWMAFIGDDPPREVLEVFGAALRARDAVIEAADRAFKGGADLRGFELDRIARATITEAGYGERFIHRTGHSIGESTHGNGANLDDLETHDTRRILPGALFSVEPGIYLPGRFGVRTEVDVYHAGDRAVVTGVPRQTELVRIVV
ncbi:MAG TPA: M24 family metallopeptidase, partial [Planctomycetota bacterium]|nr:M24 family metallopeptidase [Planctomycetota bacterium]